MPEGDTIHRLAARQQPLEGRLVTYSQFRIPSLATADITGMRIDRVYAWGKNLYWNLIGADGSELTLHTHLRMDGTWFMRPASRSPRPSHDVRLVVRVEGQPDASAEIELQGKALGMINLWPTSEFDQRTAHLGPDPLNPDWDTAGRWEPTGRAEAVARLRAQAERPLHPVLLDQRILAGVGNEYANEICFLIGRHPLTAASDVEAGELLDRMAHLMRSNLPRAARTFTGIDRPGERSFVFGRAHQPCRACGTLVRKATNAPGLGAAPRSVADPDAGQERIIWWCPTCQPGP